MQPDRLIDRQQLMKAIFSFSPNAQSKIDLRERSDGYRHGGTIVKCQSLIFEDSFFCIQGC